MIQTLALLGVCLSQTTAGPSIVAPFFACDFALVDDLDGDGLGDVAIGWRGTKAAGRVLFTSSVTAEVLKVITAEQGEIFFGAKLCVVPDLDRDGHRDLAVAAPGPPPGSTTIPSEKRFVEVISGTDGSTLRRFEADTETAGFAGSLLAIAPTTPEVPARLVLDCWEPAAHPAPGARAIRCSLLAIDLKSGCASFGRLDLPGIRPALSKPPALLGIGDVDGDLVPDFCAVLGRDAWLVSGRELRLLGGMEKLTGEVAPAHGDCTVGDLDGDRIPDFVLVIQQQEKPGTAKLAWYSGRDGRNLATVAYPGYAGRKERVLSWTLLPVDHGRARDLLLATCVDPTISTSRLVRLSGATGEFIQHMSAEHWPQIGARVEVWPEGERDGRPIYAASVSYPGLNEEQSFGVYVFEAGPPVQSLKPILASAVAGQER